MHIHGQNFAVMAESFPTYDNVTGRIVSPNPDITCGSDVLCAHPRWSGTPPDFSKVLQPVIKDTLVIPVRGYTVVRFITLNPGYWFFHCHIDVHMEGGMALFFVVSPDRLPEIPYGFPTCREFIDSCDNESNNNMTVPSYD
jgi:FtsP/CotA-like multicopper oxidase with cupredoxin domain